MAARRTIKPVRRYGFDDADDGFERSDDEPEAENDVMDVSEDGSDVSEHGSSDDSDDAEDNIDDWSEVFVNRDRAVPLQFTGHPGWQIEDEPFILRDYVDTFISETLVTKLCTWTNSRATIAEAEEYMRTNEPAEGNWTAVQNPEMKIFLGLTLAMGVIRKPTIQSYWSTEPLERTAYFATCMPRDRYRLILRYLRFSDPHKVTAGDRNSRIKELDAEMQEICQKYLPEVSLSLDESLMLHKGRLQFKMCIRTKRARFGIKIYMLCDSAGYMMCCEVYYGKASIYECGEPGVECLSKSELIVVLLLAKAKLLDRGYVLTLDNWYTSARLAHYLWTRKTAIRGTIRANRGIPDALQQKPLGPSESAYMRSQYLLAVKFNDRKVVFLLSSADAAGEVEKTRVLPGNRRITYMKPMPIENYNKSMGGVDVTDQIIAGLNCVRKSHVWFKKIGIHYVQRLLLNSFLLYRKERDPRISFYVFTKSAIAILSGMASEPTRGRQARLSAPQLPQQGNMHFPEAIPATAGNLKPRKRCKMCLRNGARKETAIQCDLCDGHPPLCVTPCFKEWHNQAME
jgi:hypothetical protein